MTNLLKPELRRAGLDDANQIAALFRLVYESSSHPCKNTPFVADTLQDSETNVWFVSEANGRLSACVGLLRHRWNRSWELVRGLTHPDDRGGGLATMLLQRAIDSAWSSDDCDLVVAFPRNRTMTRIASDAVHPALQVVGHDGGINIASGRREYHLVAVSFGDRRHDFDRVIPTGTSMATAPFVRQAVLAPLSLTGAIGPYPPVLFAGDYLRHPDYGPFTFEYHPFCPSDSLEITAYTGPKTDPGAIAADLLRTIESFGYVRHVRMAVLVDKTELCAALCAAGFAVTAYLPGWHLQNGVRYDCVLVTRCLTPEEPVDHGTRDLIDYFNQGYIACSPSTSV